MSSVCRVCLAGNRRLDPLENNSLVNVYEILANTKFNSDDTRPTALCCFCYRKLLRCHTFSQMAQRSEKIFNQLYQKGLKDIDKYCTATNEEMQPDFSEATMQNIDLDESPQTIENESILVTEPQFVEVKSESTEWKENQLILSENSNIQRNEELSQIHVEKIKLDDPKTMYNCDHCIKFFFHKTKLIYHIQKSHHNFKEKDIICSLNKKQTNNKHNEKMKLTCKYCKKQYNQNRDLAVHIMKIHTSEKPFACNICDKQFHRRDTLVKHTRIHSEVKSFTCHLCNKQFSVKGHMERHMRNHLGIKPFACNECNKRFTTKPGLIYHKRTHTVRVKAFVCNVCKKKYFLERYLVNHMKTHLGSSKTFACPDCDKVFSCSGSLDRHKVTHTGLKPFSCNECNKRFYLKYNLETHMRVHTGVTPFGCNYCDKYFKQKQTLAVHLRQHTGEKPFPCRECKRRFSSRAGLMAHKITHTGDKQFLCNVCDKKFVNKSNLVKHMRSHSGPEPANNVISGFQA